MDQEQETEDQQPKELEKTNYAQEVKSYLHNEIEWKDEKEPFSRRRRYNNLIESIGLGGVPMILPPLQSMEREGMILKPAQKQNLEFAEKLGELMKVLIKKHKISPEDIGKYNKVEIAEDEDPAKIDRTKEDYQDLQDYYEKVEQVFQDLKAQGYTGDQIRQ